MWHETGDFAIDRLVEWINRNGGILVVKDTSCKHGRYHFGVWRSFSELFAILPDLLCPVVSHVHSS